MKILEKDIPLPKIGKETSVEILFFPKSRQWDQKTKELFRFTPKAICSPDNIIHLEKRISIFKHLKDWDMDPVIGIFIDGEESVGCEYPHVRSISGNSGFRLV